MSFPFKLVRDNAFSKLKKAINKNDIEKMVYSMLNLGINSKKVKTYGENVQKETFRALRHLRRDGQLTPSIQAALELAKQKAGKTWDEAVNVPEAETSKENTTSETPKAN